MTNILQTAHSIVYERSEEKTRQYGEFHSSMERAAKIATEISGKELTTEDVYNCMIGLKLSRQAHAHKEDNLLDCIAYMASMNDYLNKTNK